MEMKYVKNGMYAIADPVLKEKEYQYKTKTISEDQLNENVDDGSGIKKPQIFIDQLIKMKDNFTLEEIKNEINTFLIAVRKKKY